MVGTHMVHRARVCAIRGSTAAGSHLLHRTSGPPSISAW